MNVFDQKLGRDFLATVPSGPGIYRIYNHDSQIIYLGKAKNLRRRLSQYRNAKRRKKHRKMQRILAETSAIQIQICESELDAELLETQLIQLYRPKWNIAGAFYFLYPMIGLKWENGVFFFCYTTQPEAFQEFTFYGSYRSREMTRDAFFSLISLFKYVGHPSSVKKKSSDPVPKYSYVYAFRQLPPEWTQLWPEFFSGVSRRVLESLVIALVENADARNKSSEVQDHLNRIARFWKYEAMPLDKALKLSGCNSHFVNQKDRDLIFLKYRHHQKSL